MPLLIDPISVVFHFISFSIGGALGGIGDGRRIPTAGPNFLFHFVELSLGLIQQSIILIESTTTSNQQGFCETERSIIIFRKDSETNCHH